MELRNYILQKVNPRVYYSHELGAESGNIVCPFHTDKNPSLHIREDGSAQCFGCNKKWRNIVEFDQAYHKCTLQKSLFYIYDNFVDPIVSRTKYLGYFQNMKINSKPYKWLINRGIGWPTIQRFLIGYNSNINKITLPIFNEWGYCVNIRLFRFEDDSPWKVINFKKGYGKPRLFPFNSLYHKEVFIFEGEMDTLLAIHLGLNSVTVTAGSQGWRREFTSYFTDKVVYICMDNDPAGIQGAKIVTKELRGVASKLYNVIIPPKFGKDFTDYIKHRPIESFLRLLDKTREVSKPDVQNIQKVRELEAFAQEETMIVDLKPGKHVLHLILKIEPDNG
jgi:DNA primase